MTCPAGKGSGKLPPACRVASLIIQRYQNRKWSHGKNFCIQWWYLWERAVRTPGCRWRHRPHVAASVSARQLRWTCLRCDFVKNWNADLRKVPGGAPHTCGRFAVSVLMKPKRHRVCRAQEGFTVSLLFARRWVCCGHMRLISLQFHFMLYEEIV